MFYFNPLHFKKLDIVKWNMKDNNASISIFIFRCIFYSSRQKCSNDKYNIHMIYHKINSIKICLYYFSYIPTAWF